MSAGSQVDDVAVVIPARNEADAGQAGCRRHGLADAIGFVPRRDDRRDVADLGPC